MKRLALLGVAAAMATVTAVPAQADNHLPSQCGGSVTIGLVEAPGGGLTYTGEIVAPLMTGTNGDHIAITSLTLSLPSPKVPAVLSDSAGSASESTLTTLKLSKTLPGAGPGSYTVAMATDLQCRAGAFKLQPTRSQVYLYVPGRAPTKLADTPKALQ